MFAATARARAYVRQVNGCPPETRTNGTYIADPEASPAACRPPPLRTVRTSSVRATAYGTYVRHRRARIGRRSPDGFVPSRCAPHRGAAWRGRLSEGFVPRRCAPHRRRMARTSFPRASSRGDVRLIDAPHGADVLFDGFVPRRCAPHAWRAATDQFASESSASDSSASESSASDSSAFTFTLPDGPPSPTDSSSVVSSRSDAAT